MLYAYAIPYWREKVVAVAHLSTKLWRNLVVLTTTFQKNKESWLFFLFFKNNLLRLSGANNLLVLNIWLVFNVMTYLHIL
jgi:hypothetical protein